jgi:phosphoribosylanthranilate isomerase
VTAVKICGITNVDDALLAAELGAFAIGMIFWPGSPRHVTAASARAIVDALPPNLEAVGVFVDQPVSEVVNIAADAGLHRVQLHGCENVGDYATADLPLVKAVALRDQDSANDALALPSSVLVLLDAHDPVKRGGTGRTIDWTLAARVAAAREIVLSGGLHADNVRDAIDSVHPFAVDVSSGVEQSPGRKDPAKLRVFFAAVRAS